MEKPSEQKKPQKLLDRETHESIRKLVMERINASSGNLVIGIGLEGYTQKEILESVERGDEIGQSIVEAHLNYLRDMAKGEIYKQDV